MVVFYQVLRTWDVGAPSPTICKINYFGVVMHFVDSLQRA